MAARCMHANQADAFWSGYEWSVFGSIYSFCKLGLVVLTIIHTVLELFPSSQVYIYPRSSGDPSIRYRVPE